MCVTENFSHRVHRSAWQESTTLQHIQVLAELQPPNSGGKPDAGLRLAAAFFMICTPLTGISIH